MVPTGQQAAGAWIDDTLKQRAAEQGLSAKVPLAADFPRQRIEVVRGPGAEERLQELFLRRGWSDGLPVVPPTVARVKAALVFIDRAPTEVLGEVEPLKGLGHRREGRRQRRDGGVPAGVPAGGAGCGRVRP